MQNLFKNKWTYVAASMLFGLIIAAIGWDKNESTIPERTHGAVFMIVTGLIMFFGAFALLVAGANRK